MSKRSRPRGEPWQQDLSTLPVLTLGLGSNTAGPALLRDARVESGPSGPSSLMLAAGFGLDLQSNYPARRIPASSVMPFPFIP